MAIREGRSFCRICLGHCGMQLKIDDETNKIVDIRGDKDNPLSQGYACFKGLQAEEAHHGESRLLHPLKRQPDGTFKQIPVEQALDEVAAKLAAIMQRDGPDAVGVYFGNGAQYNATAFTTQASFLNAIGSRSNFTAFTIDQSAKVLAFERLGGWAGGNLQLAQADVILFLGTNPLLSHGLLGMLHSQPTNRLNAERARGLKVIVIDPRKTETATHADVLIQPLPGNDAFILASLIRMVLKEGWEDKAFCERYVGTASMAALREAVEPFTEDVVEARAKLQPGDLRRVAELFARDSKQGRVYTGTGPSMAPHSNLMQHLADTLNVICGRFLRAGDKVLGFDMMVPSEPFRAEVIAPPRTSWKVPPSRIRGVGMIIGERPTGTLPDEILTPGPGQVKCLISCGGNLANLMPDQQKMQRAFDALEFKVAVEPYMTNTAKQCDYIFPPLLQYERSDLPVSAYAFAFFPEPWMQYAPALLKPPKDSEVIEEWYFFWALAKRLGKTMVFSGNTLDMDKGPTNDQLLAMRTQHPLAPLEEIKKYPSGKIYYEAQTTVLPPRPEATATFDVVPEDIGGEIAALAAELGATRHTDGGQQFTHLLSSRRMRDFYNTVGMFLPTTRKRNPYNPAFLNPEDLAAYGLNSGDRIRITSDHASIAAIVQADAGLRRGVVSMAHAWGPLPGETKDTATHGASTNLLISIDRDVEPLNSMPRMSAIPVNIARMTD